MQRRRYLAISGTALTLSMAGCAGESSGSGDVQFNAGTAPGNDDSDTTDDETQEQEQEAEPDPIEFGGSNTDITTEFPLKSGFTVFDLEHEGDLNFIVQVIRGWDRIETLSNEIGAWSATVPFSAPASTEYQLQVEADSDWSVTVRQPRPTTDDVVPASSVTLTGERPDVFGPYEFDGNTVVESSHSGESDFVVEVLAPNGELTEQLVSETGAYEGTTDYDEEGFGWIYVQAEGEYEIHLE